MSVVNDNNPKSQETASFRSEARRPLVILAALATALAALPAKAATPPVYPGFHPFSWQNYKSPLGLDASTYPDGTPTTPLGTAGLFGSLSTPMVGANTAVGDGVNIYTSVDPSGTSGGHVWGQLAPGTQIAGFELGDYYDYLGSTSKTEPPYGKNVFRDYQDKYRYWTAPSKYIYPVAASADGFSVDDSDAGFTRPSGTWTTGVALPGATKSNYSYFTGTVPTGGTATAKGLWTVSPGKAGKYHLFVNIPPVVAGETRVTDGNYTYQIGVAGTPTAFTVNQTVPGNIDTNIDVNLPASTPLLVSVDNVSGATRVVDDPAGTASPVGSWGTTAAGTAYSGSFKLDASAAAGDSFTWNFTGLDTAKTYAVQVAFPNGAYTAGAVYTVNGTHVATTSQLNTGGSWVTLYFVGENNPYGLALASTTASVVLTGPAGDPIAADALRLVQVDSQTIAATQTAQTKHGTSWTNASGTTYTATAGATSDPFYWAPILPAGKVQTYNVAVYIPAHTAGTLATDAVYTLNGNGLTPVTATVNQDAVAVGGGWVPLVDGTGKPLTVTLKGSGFSDAAANSVSLSNVTVLSTGKAVVADALQLVAVPPATEFTIVADSVQLRTNGMIVDNSDTALYTDASGWTLATGGIDKYGVDYNTVAAAATATTTATWTATLPSAGLYSVYAWFPTTSTLEPHITDASYTVNAGSITSTFTVNQTNGGHWVYVAGPLNFTTTSPTITLSNATSDDPAGKFVVADAIELVANGTGGTTFSSAAVASRSDYPELFNGYTGTDMPGGGWAQYIAGIVANHATDNHALDGTSGPIYTAHSPVRAQENLNQLVYFTRTENTPATFMAYNLAFTASGGTFRVTVDAPSGSGTVLSGAVAYNASAAALQLALDTASGTTGNFAVTKSGSTFKITFVGQYNGRTVTAPTVDTSLLTGTVIITAQGATTGVATSGAIYCVDGMTGNLVWRYPDANTPTLERPGGIASSPVILRNVMVRTNQAFGNQINHPTYASTAYPTIPLSGDIYRPRTVIVVGDNNGKLFCIDAAGNGDGDNRIVDSAGTYVDLDSKGLPVGAPSGSLQIAKSGTTRAYWCWQPDGTQPIDATYIDHIFDIDYNPAYGTVTGGGSFVAAPGSADAYGGAYQSSATVDPALTAPSTVTYVPVLPTQSGTVRLFVWLPTASVAEARTAHASYTVTDGAGAHTAYVDQSAAQGYWAPLVDATGAIYSFDASTTITAVLTNAVPSSFAEAPGKVVVADAMRVQSTAAGKLPDATTDLVVPSAYRMNSPTARLTPATFNGNPVYLATLFIGNSNGTLYSIEGSGTLTNTSAAFGSTSVVYGPLPAAIRDVSLDPAFPTVRVNWWFTTGAGMAYSPVYDPVNQVVYCTTYDRENNNRGRLFALNADLGPVGNGGKAYDATGPSRTVPIEVYGSPGTYQYNVKQVPLWSFPDLYGGLTDGQGLDLSVATYSYWVGNQLRGEPPLLTAGLAADAKTARLYIAHSPSGARPLGDIAGAPALYTTGMGSRLYIVANDPLTDQNGRIMAVNTSGSFAWSYPATNGDPNDAVTVASQLSIFTPTASPPLVIGAFTEQLDSPSYFVSSSPSIAKITFPSTTYTTGSHTAADGPLPILYAGSLNGVLYAIDIQGTDDDTRLIYNLPVMDASPIYSTTAVLSGSAATNADPTQPGMIGGSVFVTGGGGDLTQIEAMPYLFNGNVYVNTNVDFSGPGGLSSPTLGGFDISSLKGTSVNKADINTDVMEFIYAGSDKGPMTGWTPEATLGGGSSGTAGTVDTGLIPTSPPGEGFGGDVHVDLKGGSLLTAISTSPTDANWGSSVNYSPYTSSVRPAFEWGQTVYIKVFGVANPNGSGVTPTDGPNAGVEDPRLVSISLNVNIPNGRSTATVPINITMDKVVPITNVGTGWPPPNSTTANPSLGNYVGIYAFVLGNGDDTSRPQSPAANVTLTSVNAMSILDGRPKPSKAFISMGNVNPNATSASPPFDQANFSILNPLAVRGAGVSMKLAGSAPNFGNLGLPTQPTQLLTMGPFISFDSPVAASASWSTANKEAMYATGNGNNMPVMKPVAGAITTGITGGGGITTGLPIRALSTSGAANEATFVMNVATTTGMIGHGASGDNGTRLPNDPFPATSSADPSQTNDYGQSLLNVADRSAVFNLGLNLDRLRMDTPRLGWNDDSGQNGPGAVINKLPWEADPIASFMGFGNGSPDYPDIPKLDHVQVDLQSLAAGTTGPSVPITTATRSQYQITTGAGTLSTTSAGTGRTLYPHSVLVQVDVPKFQPANLEGYKIPAVGSVVNPLVSDGKSHRNPGDPSQNVVHGYIGSAKIFIDGNNDGQFTRGEAYRDVQIWTGVQVDMATAIQEPTTDVGKVPAGFGIENNLSYTSIAPSGTSAGWTPGDTTNPSNYWPWFRSVTVHNFGNTNLVNVHFDQRLADGSTDGYGNLLPPSLTLSSDGNSSMAFIPSVDSLFAGASGLPFNGILSSSALSGSYAGAMPLVRSNIDFFSPTASWDGSKWIDTATTKWSYWNTYRPNGSLLSSGTYLYPGPTFHKPRVGDNSSYGTVLTVPDQPHDAANTASSTGASPARLSIAVPLGTPVGTYAQTLRVFEAHDAAPATLANMPYVGPTYGGNFYPLTPAAKTAANADPAQTPETGFKVSSGTPQQYYSDPGTVLKVTVTEARLTSGGPLRIASGGISDSAVMPMIDSDRGSSLSGVSGLGGYPTPLTSDIQPWAFPASLYPTASGASNIGLLWTSGRIDFYDGPSKRMWPFDVFGSSMQTVAAAGASPYQPGWGTVVNTAGRSTTGGTPAFWWSDPTTVTNYGAQTLTAAAQGYDASVVVPEYANPSGPGTNYVLLVTANTTANAGAASTTTYRLRLDSLVGSDFSVLGASNTSASVPAVLTTSSEPIFHPRGVVVDVPDASQPSKNHHLLVVSWTTRIRGNTAVMYKVKELGNTDFPAVTVGTDTLLPTPTGLAEIGEALPIVRYIRALGQAQPSGTAMSPGGPVTILPYIDVTYSGRSEVNATTDIYTSRYQLVYDTTGKQWTMRLSPIVGKTGFLNESMLPDARKQVWVANDTAWVRDATRFQLWVGDPQQLQLYNGSGTIPVTIPLATNGYVNDVASGAWVFPKVLMRKETGWVVDPVTKLAVDANVTVTVNPFNGSVRFSTPPALTFQGVVIAQVAPMALRITNGSGANTQPVAFIDRAPKANAGGTSLNAVQAARYWYIYRKSGLPSTDAAAISSTLYMNTRRLTAVLGKTIGYTAPTDTPPSAVMKPTVMVYDDINGTNPNDISDMVDVDWKRGRIFFPEQFDGFYTKVSFTGVNADGTKVATVYPAAGFAPIQWIDEPYANMVEQPNPQNPSATTPDQDTSRQVRGRTVTLDNAVNEAEPSAFLDPEAYRYFNGSSHGVAPATPIAPYGSASAFQIVNPHRVMLFWSSNRNTLRQNTKPIACTLTAGTDTVTAAPTIQVTGSTTNVVAGTTILRIGRGATSEDVKVTAVSGTNLTVYGGGTGGALRNVHLTGEPVGNVRYNEFIVSDTPDASGAYRYYAARVDNPGANPITNMSDWGLYTGGSDIYWETLDPRFEVLP
ncbi:MAG TPA: hypothetical protein VGK19_00235 [Capsulimonadaceae bacterium]|jgi:hypothetical protein